VGGRARARDRAREPESERARQSKRARERARERESERARARERAREREKGRLVVDTQDSQGVLEIEHIPRVSFHKRLQLPLRKHHRALRVERRSISSVSFCTVVLVKQVKWRGLPHTRRALRAPSFLSVSVLLYS
jgi:hypothetical protein